MSLFLNNRLKCFLIVLVFCQSCWYGDDNREPEDCSLVDYETFASENGLFRVIPDQSQHRVLSEITYAISIPNQNEFFGESLLLTEESDSEQLYASFNTETITGAGIITVIAGEIGERGGAILNYNPENDTYEFEITVLLENVGSYEISSSISHSISFRAAPNCLIQLATTGPRRLQVIE